MSKRIYSPGQLTALVLLRILIGWHFLFEGVAKLINPYWSSAGYLAEAKWIFSGIFQAIVASPKALNIVDFLNIWGLIAIGLGLMTGLLATPASIAGIVLLGVYYAAGPPFIGFTSLMPAEGSYLIVDKNLVEMAALFVLVLFPTSRTVGLDRLIFRKKKSE